MVAVDTFTRDNLPVGGWEEYRKTGTTSMRRMCGPFTVVTKEGEYVLPDGWCGFLAVDAGGDPYPVDARVHAQSYKLARNGDRYRLVVWFCDLLAGLLFVGLKLGGVIGSSWWWVLAPFWIPAAVMMAVMTAGCVVMMSGWLLHRIRGFR